MKHQVAICLILCACWVAFAQNPPPNDFVEERFRNLQSKINSLLETQGLLLQRQQKIEQQLNSITFEVDRLKDQMKNSGGNFATRDELKRVVDQLKEVDQKRIADRDLLVKSIKDLAKLPTAPAAETKPRESAPPPDNVVPFKVEPGQYLSDILSAYNADLKEKGLPPITLDQVKKANPGLNPDLIRAGQTILIPVPPKAIKR